MLPAYHRCRLALGVMLLGVTHAECAPLPRPNYIGLVEQALPRLDAAFTLHSCSPATAKTPCNSAAELAAAIGAFWEVRGGVANATATARASELMRWFVESWATATHNGSAVNPDRYDFFACEPISHAFRSLARLPGGLPGLGWSSEDIANARLATFDVCGPEMRGAWNQAMSRAAGTVVALQVWPDLDVDGSWRAYVRTVLSDWTSSHAYAENSPVYNSIFFYEIFSLSLDVDVAAADTDAASPETLSMGRSWRDLMGPGGFMPAWGDAWSGAGTGASVWGFEESFYWPASFERFSAAAAAAGNATDAAAFAWAAASYFLFGSGASASDFCSAGGDPSPPPPGVATVSARSLRFIIAAEAWRARGGGGVAATLPVVSTRYTTRRLPPAGAPVPDKLVLTRVLSPGGAVPYAMAELFSSSALYHCHILQLGAVNSFSARNTTYLHHAGRDNYLAEMASTVVLWRDPMRPGPFPFPDAQAFIRPGVWTLLELPSTNLQPVSQAPEDYFIKNLTALHFFVNNKLPSGESIDIDIAFIVLSNLQTGAALIIDDFETLPWSAWPNASIETDENAPGPTHKFLRIRCGAGKSTNSRPPSIPPLALTFDARDYPLLRLYWRPSINAQNNDTSLFVIGHGPYTIPEGDFNSNTPLEGSNYDFGAGGIGSGAQYDQVPGFAPVATPLFPNFPSELDASSVRAELSPAGDSYGTFAINRHFSSGVSWTRTLVLMEEGALVSLETLTVSEGDAADGWLGGPSWLLQIPTPPTRVSANAFSASGFNVTGCFGAGALMPSSSHLLLAFFTFGADANAAVVGTTPGALVGKVFVDSVYIRSALTAGRSARFVSVLLPYDATSAPVPLAARVAAHRADAASVVSVPLEGGGAATVTVGDDGTWSVMR